MFVYTLLVMIPSVGLTVLVMGLAWFFRTEMLKIRRARTWAQVNQVEIGSEESYRIMERQGIDPGIFF